MCASPKFNVLSFRKVFQSWLLLLICDHHTFATIVANTTELKEGIVRYHYENKPQNHCSNVVIIGVGTTMRVEDYDHLSLEIATHNPDLVSIIIDHAPGNPLKLSTSRYANLVHAIAASMEEIIPACRGSEREEFGALQLQRNVFIGGHSASGMVAIKALPLIKDIATAGFIGLSPFKITQDMTRLSVPTLLWGFSTTTCGVSIGKAADKAYNLSSVNHGRVLYQLQNPEGSPSHCIFANHGCGPICPSLDDASHAWIRSAVGDSIRRFLRAVESHSFTRSSLHLDLPEQVDSSYLRMYINQDSVPIPSSIIPAIENE